MEKKFESYFDKYLTNAPTHGWTETLLQAADKEIAKLKEELEASQNLNLYLESALNRCIEKNQRSNR